MKKLFHVALVLLSNVWATNAQQLNKPLADSEVADATITATNTEPVKNINLFTKAGLLTFNNTGLPEKTDYLKKSRNQKTGAWILLGTGIAAMVTGIIVESTNSVENVVSTFSDEPRNNTGTIIAVIGGCIMVGSVPLFVSSSRNKSKANLSAGSQKTGSGVVVPGVGKTITGITMSIPIGR